MIATTNMHLKKHGMTESCDAFCREVTERSYIK